MSKYDNMGLSPEEIKELERLDAEEMLLEKQNRINNLKRTLGTEQKVVVQAKKSKNGYQFLGLFLGIFGLHDFYAGFYKLGLIYLISTIIAFFTIPGLIIFIWCIAVLEIIVSVKDANGNKLE